MNVWPNPVASLLLELLFWWQSVLYATLQIPVRKDISFHTLGLLSLMARRTLDMARRTPAYDAKSVEWVVWGRGWEEGSTS